jgi:hypothetical protein
LDSLFGSLFNSWILIWKINLLFLPSSILKILLGIV